MTYLIPQSHLSQTPSSTPAAMLTTQNNNVNGSIQHVNGKRSSPNSSNSSSTAPATTFQQFPQSVPLPPSMYQNVVQYPASNFYPQQQTPTLVGSVVPQATNQIQHQTYSSACTEVPCYPYPNQATNQTPQSTPSTPLSLANLSTTLPYSKNVPLFATPPVLAAPGHQQNPTTYIQSSSAGNVDLFEKRYPNGTKKKENGNYSFQYNAPINVKTNSYIRPSQSISNPPSMGYQNKKQPFNNNIIASEDTTRSRKNSYSPSPAVTTSFITSAKTPQLNR